MPSYQTKPIKAVELQSGSFKMSGKNFKDLKEYLNFMSEKHFILKHEFYDSKNYVLLKEIIQKSALR